MLLVALGGFALAGLSALARDVSFGLFGAILGLVALFLGYRMVVASLTGRRLYWWAGEREHDRGSSP